MISFVTRNELTFYIFSFFMNSINDYLISEATRLTGDVTGRTETTAGRSEPTNHSAASERTRTDQTLRNPERQREGTGTRSEANDQ